MGSPAIAFFCRTPIIFGISGDSRTTSSDIRQEPNQLFSYLFVRESLNMPSRMLPELLAARGRSTKYLASVLKRNYFIGTTVHDRGWYRQSIEIIDERIIITD